MDLKEKIRIIEDFPQKGISYKDITTLTADGAAFASCVDQLAASITEPVDIIVGPEARGFVFSSAVAYKLGCGFVPIRKPGKLPADTIKYEYALEYGTDTLEMHKDAVKPGDRVVIMDDLSATGGTLEACAKLVESLGGIVVGIVVVIELTDLGGREKLAGYKLTSLIQYPF